MTIVLLILGLILFIGLVLIHEFGHYIMARRNGVEVEEFGLGFPPRAKILGKRKGTLFTLNWLPLGGFVRLKGEHDSDTAHGTFGAATLLAKVKIMTAGVVMNLLVAIVLLTLLAITGLPQLITKDTQGVQQFTVSSDEHVVTKQVLVNYVEAGAPGAQAGLKTADRILSLESNGVTNQISTIEDLKQATAASAGKQVTVRYARDGQTLQTLVQLRTQQEIENSVKQGNPKGYIGIGLAPYQVNRYTWSAPVVATGLTVQLTKLTLQGLSHALKGLGGIFAGLLTQNTPARQAAQTAATEQVSGPLGIFFIMQSGAHQGIGMILFIIALISLTLAIMNVLPIPALDGGRLFVTLFFRAIRKPLERRTEELIHGTGFAALMVLFLLITFVDVKRFM